MSKIFVIAGTTQEANRWIKDECDRRWHAGDTSVTLGDYIYITGAERIRGYSNPHGRFVGNWLGRPDILEIVEQLQLCSTQVNPALDKIYKDLKPMVRPTPKLQGKQITHIIIDEL